MLRDGPVNGEVSAMALRDDASGVLLPLIDLTATATSSRAAVELAARDARALDSYVADQQKTNNVPVSDRVVIRTVVAPKRPHIFQPRSKTLAIVVFLAVMLATVGLAFVLENLRPRVRKVSTETETQLETFTRRTA
jgi:hypothetical protein